MSMRRTPSGIPIWFIGVLFFALLIGLQLYFYVEKQKYHQLRMALGELQREIESDAVDHEGSYPESLEQLLAERKIVLGKNPFGPGRLEILQPGDPWEPGGIVYVPSGPLVMPADNDDLANAIIPTDNDQYILVAYGPREHEGKQRAHEQAKIENEQALAVFKAGDSQTLTTVFTADGIEWDHVEFMLTAGEDYLENR